jgi:hypothetical protein
MHRIHASNEGSPHDESEKIFRADRNVLDLFVECSRSRRRFLFRLVGFVTLVPGPQVTGFHDEHDLHVNPVHLVNPV